MGCVGFPRAAVTKHHKLGGLKQKCILSVLEARCPQERVDRAVLLLKAHSPTPFSKTQFDLLLTWLYRCVCVLSLVQLLATPWIIACPAPLSVEFSGQNHWNGLPFPSQGDLPDPGIKPGSPALQADSLSSELPEITLTGILFPNKATFTGS